MNISAFLGYLNKTRGYHLDADYSGYIETWRQWWKGSVPGVHTRSAEYADGTKKRKIASLRMPKRVCEDWANLLLNDRTTFQIVEDDILRDVARRISKMETLTPTANWQLWRYQQTEAVRQDVIKKLARYTGKSEAEIRRLMQEAATRALEAEDRVYYHYDLEPTPFEENATLQALLNAGYQQTAGTFHNLTGTTANTVSGQFEAALDRAHLKVSTGAFDYKSAIKSAVDSLADTMKYVTYPTGHQDTLEVAARRCVLTGVNQTCAKLQLERARQMGVRYVQVTAHGGARPSHAEWQGKIYALNGFYGV